jgi:hypothetical protein
MRLGCFPVALFHPAPQQIGGSFGVTLGFLVDTDTDLRETVRWGLVECRLRLEQ